MKPLDTETSEVPPRLGRKVFGQTIYVNAFERRTYDRSPRLKRAKPLPDRIEVKLCPQENYRGRMKYQRTRSIPELCRITLKPTGYNHLHQEQMEEVYISQYTHCFDGKIEKPHIVAWKQDFEKCHVDHRDSKLCIMNSPMGSKSRDVPERPKSAPPGSLFFDFEKMDVPEPLSRRSTSPGMFIENWMDLDETDYESGNSFRPLTNGKMDAQMTAHSENLSFSLLEDTFDNGELQMTPHSGQYQQDEDTQDSFDNQYLEIDPNRRRYQKENDNVDLRNYNEKDSLKTSARWTERKMTAPNESQSSNLGHQSQIGYRNSIYQEQHGSKRLLTKEIVTARTIAPYERLSSTFLDDDFDQSGGNESQMDPRNNDSIEKSGSKRTLTKEFVTARMTEPYESLSSSFLDDVFDHFGNEPQIGPRDSDCQEQDDSKRLLAKEIVTAQTIEPYESLSSSFLDDVFDSFEKKSQADPVKSDYLQENVPKRLQTEEIIIVQTIQPNESLSSSFLDDVFESFNDESQMGLDQSDPQQQNGSRTPLSKEIVTAQTIQPYESLSSSFLDDVFDSFCEESQLDSGESNHQEKSVPKRSPTREIVPAKTMAANESLSSSFLDDVFDGFEEGSQMDRNLTDYHKKNVSKTFRPLTKKDVTAQREVPNHSLSSGRPVETMNYVDKKLENDPQDLTHQARSLISTLRSSVKPPDDFRNRFLKSVHTPQAMKVTPVSVFQADSSHGRREAQLDKQSKTTYVETRTDVTTQRMSKSIKYSKKTTEEKGFDDRLRDLIGDLEPSDSASAFKVTKAAQKENSRRYPQSKPGIYGGSGNDEATKVKMNQPKITPAINGNHTSPKKSMTTYDLQSTPPMDDEKTKRHFQSTPLIHNGRIDTPKNAKTTSKSQSMPMVHGEQSKAVQKAKTKPDATSTPRRYAEDNKVFNSSLSATPAAKTDQSDGWVFKAKRRDESRRELTTEELDESAKKQQPEAEVIRPRREPRETQRKKKDDDLSQPSIYSKVTSLSNYSRPRTSSLGSEASYKRRLTYAWIEQQRQNIKRDLLENKEQRLRRTKSADLQIDGFGFEEDKQEMKLKHSKSEASFDQLNAMYDPFDGRDFMASSNRKKAHVVHTSEPAVITKARSFEQKLHHVTHESISSDDVNQNKRSPSESEESKTAKHAERNQELTTKEINTSNSDQDSSDVKRHPKNLQTSPPKLDRTGEFMSQSEPESSSPTRIQAKHVEKKKAIPNLSENRKSDDLVMVTSRETSFVDEMNKRDTSQIRPAISSSNASPNIKRIPNKITGKEINPSLEEKINTDEPVSKVKSEPYLEANKEDIINVPSRPTSISASPMNRRIRAKQVDKTKINPSPVKNIKRGDLVPTVISKETDSQLEVESSRDEHSAAAVTPIVSSLNASPNRKNRVQANHLGETNIIPAINESTENKVKPDVVSVTCSVVEARPASQLIQPQDKTSDQKLIAVRKNNPGTLKPIINSDTECTKMQNDSKRIEKLTARYITKEETNVRHISSSTDCLNFDSNNNFSDTDNNPASESPSGGINQKKKRSGKVGGILNSLGIAKLRKTKSEPNLEKGSLSPENARKVGESEKVREVNGHISENTPTHPKGSPKVGEKRQQQPNDSQQLSDDATGEGERKRSKHGLSSKVSSFYPKFKKFKEKLVKTDRGNDETDHNEKTDGEPHEKQEILHTSDLNTRQESGDLETSVANFTESKDPAAPFDHQDANHDKTSDSKDIDTHTRSTNPRTTAVDSKDKHSRTDNSLLTKVTVVKRDIQQQKHMKNRGKNRVAPMTSSVKVVPEDRSGTPQQENTKDDGIQWRTQWITTSKGDLRHSEKDNQIVHTNTANVETTPNKTQFHGDEENKETIQRKQQMPLSNEDFNGKQEGTAAGRITSVRITSNDTENHENAKNEMKRERATDLLSSHNFYRDNVNVNEDDKHNITQNENIAIRSDNNEKYEARGIGNTTAPLHEDVQPKNGDFQIRDDDEHNKNAEDMLGRSQRNGLVKVKVSSLKNESKTTEIQADSEYKPTLKNVEEETEMTEKVSKNDNAEKEEIGTKIKGFITRVLPFNNKDKNAKKHLTENETRKKEARITKKVAKDTESTNRSISIHSNGTLTKTHWFIVENSETGNQKTVEMTTNSSTKHQQEKEKRDNLTEKTYSPRPDINVTVTTVVEGQERRYSANKPETKTFAIDGYAATNPTRQEQLRTNTAWKPNVKEKPSRHLVRKDMTATSTLDDSTKTHVAQQYTSIRQSVIPSVAKVTAEPIRNTSNELANEKAITRTQLEENQEALDSIFDILNTEYREETGSDKDDDVFLPDGHDETKNRKQKPKAVFNGNIEGYRVSSDCRVDIRNENVFTSKSPSKTKDHEYREKEGKEGKVETIAKRREGMNVFVVTDYGQETFFTQKKNEGAQNESFTRFSRFNGDMKTTNEDKRQSFEKMNVFETDHPEQITVTTHEKSKQSFNEKASHSGMNTKPSGVNHGYVGYGRILGDVINQERHKTILLEAAPNTKSQNNKMLELVNVDKDITTVKDELYQQTEMVDSRNRRQGSTVFLMKNEDIASKRELKYVEKVTVTRTRGPGHVRRMVQGDKETGSTESPMTVIETDRKNDEKKVPRQVTMRTKDRNERSLTTSDEAPIKDTSDDELLRLIEDQIELENDNELGTPQESEDAKSDVTPVPDEKRLSTGSTSHKNIQKSTKSFKTASGIDTREMSVGNVTTLAEEGRATTQAESGRFITPEAGTGVLGTFGAESRRMNDKRNESVRVYSKKIELSKVNMKKAEAVVVSSTELNESKTKIAPVNSTMNDENNRRGKTTERYRNQDPPVTGYMDIDQNNGLSFIQSNSLQKRSLEKGTLDEIPTKKDKRISRSYASQMVQEQTMTERTTRSKKSTKRSEKRNSQSSDDLSLRIQRLLSDDSPEADESSPNQNFISPIYSFSEDSEFDSRSKNPYRGKSSKVSREQRKYKSLERPKRTTQDTKKSRSSHISPDEYSSDDHEESFLKTSRQTFRLHSKTL